MWQGSETSKTNIKVIVGITYESNFQAAYKETDRFAQRFVQKRFAISWRTRFVADRF